MTERERYIQKGFITPARYGRKLSVEELGSLGFFEAAQAMIDRRNNIKKKERRRREPLAA